MACSDLISTTEMETAKLEAETITEFVESSGTTLLTPQLQTKKTINGIIADGAAAIVALGWDNKGEFSTLPTMTDANDVAVFEGNFWVTTEPLPYTATGASPLTAPEAGKWVVAVTSELLGIARSFNTLNSNVVYDYAGNVVTEYIYSGDQEITYRTPTEAIGKTITSLIVDQLTTTDAYVCTLEKAIANELSAIARSLNFLDSQVIYSTDTVTVLDDVLCIYDSSAQVTFKVPDLNGAGETIISVNGTDLVTSGGSYTLINSKNILVNGGTDYVKIEDKLTVDLYDFGGVGDGVTDDTQAILSALTYMVITGRNVTVPIGTWLTDPFSVFSLAYDSQSSFIGSDAERCIIKRRVAGATPFMTVGSPTSTSFMVGVGMSGLTIDGGSSANGDAFVGYDVVRSKFTKVTFQGGDACCRLFGGISVTFSDCKFQLSRKGLKISKFESLAGGGWPNIIRVRGGEIVDNTEYGVWFDNGRALILDSVEIEGNGTTIATDNGGVYIGPNVGEEVFATDTFNLGLISSGCWFEANRGHADVLLLSGINSITEGTFFSNSSMVTNDIRIDGGKYSLKNINASHAKTVNILEGAAVSSGNTLIDVEASVIYSDASKTTLITNGFINLQNGRVASFNGYSKPLVQTGIDATSANPTITFPIAFSSTPKIYCQPVNESASTIDSIDTYNITPTGFTIRKKTTDLAIITTANYSVSWFAVGEI